MSCRSVLIDVLPASDHCEETPRRGILTSTGSQWAPPSASRLGPSSHLASAAGFFRKDVVAKKNSLTYQENMAASSNCHVLPMGMSDTSSQDAT